MALLREGLLDEYNCHRMLETVSEHCLQIVAASHHATDSINVHTPCADGSCGTIGGDDCPAKHSSPSDAGTGATNALANYASDAADIRRKPVGESSGSGGGQTPAAGPSDATLGMRSAAGTSDALSEFEGLGDSMDGAAMIAEELDFADEIDAIEAARDDAASQLREQSLVLQVSLAYLAEEVGTFLEREAAHVSFGSAGGAEIGAIVDEETVSGMLATKRGLEQILFKLKALATDFAVNERMRATLAEVLEKMRDVAEVELDRVTNASARVSNVHTDGVEGERELVPGHKGQLRASATPALGGQDGDDSEDGELTREASDLELLIVVTHAKGEECAHAPACAPETVELLIRFVRAIKDLDEAQLASVQHRLDEITMRRDGMLQLDGVASADTSGAAVDQVTCNGMSKLVHVLRSELSVLDSLLQSHDSECDTLQGQVASDVVPRLLVGLVHVLSGVLLRLGMRLAIVERARDRQVHQIRDEMAARLRDAEHRLQLALEAAAKREAQLSAQNHALRAENHALLTRQHQLQRQLAAAEPHTLPNCDATSTGVLLEQHVVVHATGGSCGTAFDPSPATTERSTASASSKSTVTGDITGPLDVGHGQLFAR